MKLDPTGNEPAIHVTLGGHQDGAVTSALDDAMEKLAGLAGPITPDAAQCESNRRDTARLLGLVEALSESASRLQAIAELAHYVAQHAHGGAVRCAYGTSKLTHFFDARMGWIGPDTSLRIEASERWQETVGHPRRRADDRPQVSPDDHSDLDSSTSQQPVTASWRTIQDGIELHLPQPDGPGHCVVSIHAESLDRSSTVWLTDAISTVTSVFWSRPARSWPTTLARLGRRTKIAAFVILVVLGVLAIWPVHYRVACTAQVETLKQRLIAAPFQASLLKTNVRPGDRVSAGDVLVVLDGRPLRLERESLEAEIGQASKEHDVALATGKIADAQQAKLKRQQLARRYDLLSDRLDRLEVVSPIDGVVVSGDLERFVGSPLQLGQTLMEVAPMDYMQIEIEVPEHEVGYVSSHAETRVKFAAIGGKSLRLRLDELFPSAEVRDDRNVFVGRIKVNNRNLNLRPGMRGEATAYGPLRPWIWSWVRGAFERTLWWIGY